MWGTETTELRAIRLLRLIQLWKHRGYTRAWVWLARALRESREEGAIFLAASGLTLYIAAIGALGGRETQSAISVLFISSLPKRRRCGRRYRNGLAELARRSASNRRRIGVDDADEGLVHPTGVER